MTPVKNSHTVAGMGATPSARSLVPQIRRDLARKMVFVAGPRQVGKTTLARSLPGAAAGYLDWDVSPNVQMRPLRNV